MWSLDKVLQITSAANVFSTVDVMIVLVMVTILSFIATKTYQTTHEGISYSPSFVHTLVMFGVLVSMIMLIIGSNIARAFTLVGALSVVRFRNAIKDTKDVGFIFFLMAIGMAVGTRFYLLAIMMTLFICVLLIIMHKFNYGYMKKEDFILKVTSDINIEKKIKPLLNKYTTHHELLNIETTEDPNLSEYGFLIRVEKDGKKTSTLLIKEIKKLNKVGKVSILGTGHLVY